MTILERFINLGEVEITPHPITSTRRLAILEEDSFKWAPRGKQVILDYTIYYLDENGDKYNLESMPCYKKRLMADLTARVDIQGNVVPKVETVNPVLNDEDEIVNQEELDEYNNYIALKTEYQFIVDIANNDVNIFQVMLNTTLLRANQGKFDK